MELMPLSPTARSARTVALVGASNLLAASRAALEAGDLQWALELATHVWRGDPTNALALEARVDALRALGAREHNPLGRNFYLTTALTDTGNEKQTVDLRLIIQVRAYSIFLSVFCQYAAGPWQPIYGTCLSKTPVSLTMCAMRAGVII